MIRQSETEERDFRNRQTNQDRTGLETKQKEAHGNVNKRTDCEM